jgi:ribosomal protein L10
LTRNRNSENLKVITSMAKTRVQKEETLEYLKSNLAVQKSILLLTTNKAEQSLTADLNVGFRKDAYALGIRVKVFNNNLLRQVFGEIPEEITGQTYVTYLSNKDASDEITVAKNVVTLLKKDEYKNCFKVVGAILEDKFLDQTEANVLANTMTKEESMAAVAGMIKSILAKPAILVKEISAKTARAVDAVSKQKA